MKISVVIAAAGKSKRMGKDKLLLPLGNGCLLASTVRPFLSIPDLDQIVISTLADSVERFREEFQKAELPSDRIRFVCGGDTRTESVMLALAVLPKDTDYVLVHDGARPFADSDLISRVLEKTKQIGVAIPVVNLKDSVLVNDSPFNRKYVKRVQTPQGFDFKKLLGAYMLISPRQTQPQITDDYTVWCCAYGDSPDAQVEGDYGNRKITTPSDLPAFFGTGYDVHRFIDGDHVFLGGVRVPCDRAVEAHSDGDVLIHALMDAALSTAGLPDIGHVFPVTDPKYKGANSLDLLKQTLEMTRTAGVEINHVSATVIAERPKLAPYIDEIRESLARAFNIPTAHVGLSATTNEKVGEIGKGQAIAAYATVTAELY